MHRWATLHCEWQWKQIPGSGFGYISLWQCDHFLSSVLPFPYILRKQETQISNLKTNKLALVKTQNLILKQFTCKNCSYQCAYDCTQLCCTMQHNRTVLIIFPLILQTIIIVQMLSNGGRVVVVPPLVVTAYQSVHCLFFRWSVEDSGTVFTEGGQIKFEGFTGWWPVWLHSVDVWTTACITLIGSADTISAATINVTIVQCQCSFTPNSQLPRFMLSYRYTNLT